MKLIKLLFVATILLLPLCANAEGDEYYYHNPVVKMSLPDPTVIRAEDGFFYLFATENTRNMPMYRSSDLVNWHFLGTVFTDYTRPTLVTDGRLWAPDINYINGKYVLYYCMSLWGGIYTSGVGIAVADKPDGPYTDLGKLFDSPGIDVQNSIDQFYFMEQDGSKYLFWGSFSGIYAIELSDDGLSVKEGAVKHRVAGSYTEGTSIYKHDNYYYMIGSAGSCCEGVSSTYHLVVARSENLLGPYLDKDGLPALNNHFSEMLHRNRDVVGPGHCSEIIEDDMGQTWLMYHGFMADNADAGRVLYLDQVYWDSEGWPYIVSEKPSTAWSKPVFSDQKFTYSDVDYIEFTGDRDGDFLFDTGYVPKENTRIEVQCRSYSKNKDGEQTANSWRGVFSSGITTANGYSLFVYDDGTQWGYFSAGYIKDKIAPHEYDKDYTISGSRYSLTVNGVTYPTDFSAYTGTTARLTLFKGFQGRTYCGRIYSLKIYEGDELIHDYKPCLRNEDKLPMFHDTVKDIYVHPSDPSAFSYGKVIE